MKEGPVNVRVSLIGDAYFSNKITYKKNKKCHFTVENRKSSCTAITTNLIEEKGGLNKLESPTFIGNSVREENLLILSDGIDEKEGRLIQKAFDADPNWVEVEGYEVDWDLQVDVVVGEFLADNVQVNSLSFVCAQTNVSIVEIPENIYVEAISSGLPSEINDDFLGHIKMEGPTIEKFSFKINGKTNKEVEKHIKEKYQELLAKNNPAISPEKACIAVQVSRSKRANYSLSIFEPFDQAKLNLDLETLLVKGFSEPFIVFRLAYGDSEFEFQEDSGGAVDIFVIGADAHPNPVSIAY